MEAGGCDVVSDPAEPGSQFRVAAGVSDELGERAADQLTDFLGVEGVEVAGDPPAGITGSEDVGGEQMAAGGWCICCCCGTFVFKNVTMEDLSRLRECVHGRCRFCVVMVGCGRRRAGESAAGHTLRYRAAASWECAGQ